ncbi:MAG TPA: PIG-L deacetylase family protein [Patescibacteria group bacterium]|nr:PIG-L deacetylase family protein [Patescibacteria group bacterium]
MKNLVCIFAHPDDEAFGPGGTIAKLAKIYNIYLLCATKGEAGLQNQKSKIKSQNSKSKVKSLGAIRTEELKLSAKILGVKEVYFLGFKDGTLSNNLYPEIVKRIEVYLKKLKPEILLTFEPLGLSGHIDHIVISMVTMFVAGKSKFVKEVWQNCRLEAAERKQNYFVYMPPGYKKSQIHKTINVEDIWEQKIAAMRAHKSQFADFERIMEWLEKSPKEEYFLVIKK